MNAVTKFEALGIFFSIAIMAVALAMVRFKGVENSPLASIEPNTQGALVVEGDTTLRSDGELAQALGEAATASGELVRLVIDDIKVGTGEAVKEGDTISVNYIGTTQDGVQFDNSYTRGEPYTFRVGEGKVIEGWDKGLIGMKVGGNRILVIPASMAYGNRQVGPIPAGSNLVFALELVEIK